MCCDSAEVFLSEAFKYLSFKHVDINTQSVPPLHFLFFSFSSEVHLCTIICRSVLTLPCDQWDIVVKSGPKVFKESAVGED